MLATLRPDQQDSQKGLQAAVRVCHPCGCLRDCLEDYSMMTPANDASPRAHRILVGEAEEWEDELAVQELGASGPSE